MIRVESKEERYFSLPHSRPKQEPKPMCHKTTESNGMPKLSVEGERFWKSLSAFHSYYDLCLNHQSAIGRTPVCCWTYLLAIIAVVVVSSFPFVVVVVSYDGYYGMHVQPFHVILYHHPFPSIEYFLI